MTVLKKKLSKFEQILKILSFKICFKVLKYLNNILE